MQGVVIENISNLYKVQIFGDKSQKLEGLKKTIYEATARGKEKKEAVIEKILPRKNFVKRPKVSNITQLILVLSSKHPKPDLLMLDKQLAFAEFLNLKTVIVLNKVDLDESLEFINIQKLYENIGYKVIKTQANNGTGVGELIKLMNNNINVFSGNSGVGKSSLINAIFNNNITQEGEISKKNKRGKNTTTSTKLYEIDNNTYIADTPGFSTFDISEIESKDLYRYFKEFSDKNCKYVGCTHIKEEDCGIKQDVKIGKISEERYNRFCKIYNELKIGENKKW